MEHLVKYSKPEIAKMLLRGAMDHYLQEEYVISLHLAGAAEEILGKLAKYKGEYPHIDAKIDLEKAWDEFFGEKRDTKAILKSIGKAKNSIKHFDEPQETEVSADWKEEAYAMITGALINYDKVYGKLPSWPDMDLSG